MHRRWTGKVDRFAKHPSPRPEIERWADRSVASICHLVASARERNPLDRLLAPRLEKFSASKGSECNRDLDSADGSVSADANGVTAWSWDCTQSVFGHFSHPLKPPPTRTWRHVALVLLWLIAIVGLGSSRAQAQRPSPIDLVPPSLNEVGSAIAPSRSGSLGSSPLGAAALAAPQSFGSSGSSNTTQMLPGVGRLAQGTALDPTLQDPFADAPYRSIHPHSQTADWAMAQSIDSPPGVWQHQFLPQGTLYPFYLPDPKASRLSATWLEAQEDSSLLDGTLGGRFGLYRYSDNDPLFARGVQVDLEGASQLRLDMEEERDVRSVDFRAGMPVGISFGQYQVRVGYYHLSSHLGDEFLLKNPTFNRLNFSRDCLLLGNAYWWTPNLRTYAEAAWAFYNDVSQEWEFQFGVDYAPRFATGTRGAPFFGIGGHLREELDFGGAITAQAGWAWRSRYNSGLLRMGLHYYNGNSPQLSFFNFHEQQFGFGLWYDF
jgi:hypothetical protein